MSDIKEKTAARPKWLKLVMVIFACYAVLYFGWLGWMVLAGDEEGPIMEKNKPAVLIGLLLVVAGPFVIITLDLTVKMVRKIMRISNK